MDLDRCSRGSLKREVRLPLRFLAVPHLQQQAIYPRIGRTHVPDAVTREELLQTQKTLTGFLAVMILMVHYRSDQNELVELKESRRSKSVQV